MEMVPVSALRAAQVETRKARSLQNPLFMRSSLAGFPPCSLNSLSPDPQESEPSARANLSSQLPPWPPLPPRNLRESARAMTSSCTCTTLRPAQCACPAIPRPSRLALTPPSGRSACPSPELMPCRSPHLPDDDLSSACRRRAKRTRSSPLPCPVRPSLLSTLSSRSEGSSSSQLTP